MFCTIFFSASIGQNPMTNSSDKNRKNNDGAIEITAGVASALVAGNQFNETKERRNFDIQKKNENNSTETSYCNSKINNTEKAAPRSLLSQTKDEINSKPRNNIQTIPKNRTNLEKFNRIEEGMRKLQESYQAMDLNSAKLKLLNQDLQKIKEQIEKYSSSSFNVLVEEFEKKLQDLNQEQKQSRDNQIDKIKNIFSHTMESYTSDIRNKIDDISQTIQTINSSSSPEIIETLKLDIEKYNNTLEQYQQANTEIMTEISEFKEKINEINQNKEDLFGNVEKINEQLNTLNEQNELIQKLNEKIEEIVKQKDSNSRELNDIKRQLEEHETKAKTLNIPETLSKIKKDQSDITEKMEQLKSDMSKMQTGSKLVNNPQNTISDFNKKIEDFEKNLIELSNKKTTELSEKMTKQEHTVAYIESQMKEFRENINNFTPESKKAYQNLQNETNKIQKELETIKKLGIVNDSNEFKKILSQTKEWNTEIVQIKNHLSSYMDKHKEMQEKIDKIALNNINSSKLNISTFQPLTQDKLDQFILHGRQSATQFIDMALLPRNFLCIGSKGLGKSFLGEIIGTLMYDHMLSIEGSFFTSKDISDSIKERINTGSIKDKDSILFIFDDQIKGAIDEICKTKDVTKFSQLKSLLESNKTLSMIHENQNYVFPFKFFFTMNNYDDVSIKEMEDKETEIIRETYNNIKEKFTTFNSISLTEQQIESIFGMYLLNNYDFQLMIEMHAKEINNIDFYYYDDDSLEVKEIQIAVPNSVILNRKLFVVPNFRTIKDGLDEARSAEKNNMLNVFMKKIISNNTIQNINKKVKDGDIDKDIFIKSTSLEKKIQHVITNFIKNPQDLNTNFSKLKDYIKTQTEEDQINIDMLPKIEERKDLDLNLKIFLICYKNFFENQRNIYVTKKIMSGQGSSNTHLDDFKKYLTHNNNIKLNNIEEEAQKSLISEFIKETLTSNDSKNHQEMTSDMTRVLCAGIKSIRMTIASLKFCLIQNKRTLSEQSNKKINNLIKLKEDKLKEIFQNTQQFTNAIAILQKEIQNIQKADGSLNKSTLNNQIKKFQQKIAEIQEKKKKFHEISKKIDQDPDFFNNTSEFFKELSKALGITEHDLTLDSKDISVFRNHGANDKDLKKIGFFDFEIDPNLKSKNDILTVSTNNKLQGANNKNSSTITNNPTNNQNQKVTKVEQQAKTATKK